MGKLTEDDLTGLRWAAACNDEFGIGFLGPTVRRHGPAPEYASLVALGLLQCETGTVVRPATTCGYFITEAGRAALQSQEKAK